MPWQLSNSRRAEGEPKRNRRGGIAASEKQKQRRLETKRRKLLVDNVLVARHVTVSLIDRKSVV